MLLNCLQENSVNQIRLIILKFLVAIRVWQSVEAMPLHGFGTVLGDFHSVCLSSSRNTWMMLLVIWLVLGSPMRSGELILLPWGAGLYASLPTWDILWFHSMILCHVAWIGVSCCECPHLGERLPWILHPKAWESPNRLRQPGGNKTSVGLLFPEASAFHAG